jgi:nucleotide sugar dehydrogenase
MKIFGLKKEQILKLFESSEITFSVYGLGKMGLPLAAVIADTGGKVIGVDINKNIVEGVNKGLCHVKCEPGLDEMIRQNVENGRLTATDDLVKASEDSDVKVILVPTFLDSMNNPDLSIIKSVSKSISRGLKRGDFVITESTLPPPHYP